VNIEPGIVEFTEVLTIVGGTGRFVAATGTFTLRRTGRLDVAAGTSSSSGSFEGSISLPK
jgi:adhesin HecA-like repeat protein